MSYAELLKLPIRTFWRLHYNINRIRAEADIRSFHIAAAAQSTEGHKLRDHLTLELGDTTTIDPVASASRDKDADAKLKKLMG